MPDAVKTHGQPRGRFQPNKAGANRAVSYCEVYSSSWSRNFTTGASITGPAAESGKIPGIDRTVKEGDQVTLGSVDARVIEVPAHTAGHIAYHLADADDLICGDTLFPMGGGRLVEGTPQQLWGNLEKMTALPGASRGYGAL